MSRLGILILDVAQPMPQSPSKVNPQGDLDNLAKGPMDALTDAEMLWHDDTQVCLLVVGKRFVETEEQAGVWFSYYQLPEGDSNED